jgi:hypothetical protein
MEGEAQEKEEKFAVTTVRKGSGDVPTRCLRWAQEDQLQEFRKSLGSNRSSVESRMGKHESSDGVPL